MKILLTVYYLLAALFGLGIGVIGFYLGVLFNVLFILLFVIASGGVVSRVVGFINKNIEMDFVRRPFEAVNRRYLVQCFNQWTFFILAEVVLWLAIIPAQFSPREYWTIHILALVASLTCMACSLVPLRAVRISVNLFFVAGWSFLGLEVLRILNPGSTAESVVLTPPFRGEWYVFHGGPSSLINHHYPIHGQRDALDIIKTKEGRVITETPGSLEDYPAFGEVIYAPADGRVVKVLNDRPDVEIGDTDLEQIAGNHVVLDIGNERFVLLAHLKYGSVRVALGDAVTTGTPIAECGNSGNTSEPHLHLQVQNREDFYANDLRTFPIIFRDLIRVRYGRREQLSQTSLRRNDIVIIEETNSTSPAKHLSPPYHREAL